MKTESSGGTDTAIQKDGAVKAPRPKSTSYPNHSLQIAEEIVRKIYQNYGNSIFVSRDQLEETLDKSASHLASYVSAAGQYGLLDVNRGEGYRVTDLFLKLYKPLSDDERKTGLLDCINHPVLYNKLIQQFNNKKLPNIDALATILFRSYGIAENASKSAAKIFIDNLTNLNLLDSENMLFFNKGNGSSGDEIDFSEVDKNDSSSVAIAKASEKQKQLPSSTTVIVPETDYLNYPLPLDGGRKAWIKIPENFTNEDLTRIINFAEGLKYK